MRQFADTYEDERAVNRISNMNEVSQNVRESRIHEVRSRMSIVEGNSSLKTVLSIANNNFGFSLLVYGMHVDKNGFFLSIPCLLFAWYMGTHSAHLMVKHFREDEADYPDIVGRVIGNKAKMFYQLTSLIYLLFLNILYYIYACDMTYNILNYFLQISGKSSLPLKSEFVLSEFSYQWIGIIFIVIYFVLLQLQDLDFLIKLSPLGLIAVFVIVTYSVVRGAMNIGEAGHEFRFEFDYKQFAQLVGTFTTGFFSHPFFFPVLKKNQNFDENYDNTTKGFGLTGITYLIASVFGAIAISQVKEPQNPPSSIYDYFDTNWITVILRAMVTIQLSTVLPIVMFIMRTQFWSAVKPGENISIWKNNFINFAYAIISLCLQMFNVDPSIMIGLAGSIGGYFGIYIFAPWVHYKCLRSHVQNSDATEEITEEMLSGKANLVTHHCKSIHTQDKNGKMNSHFGIIFHIILAIFGMFVLIVNIIGIK